MSRNDKSNEFKNPVGPDQPLVRFDVPLWQVFVALFLIALVLTAFKWYERNHIAPHQAVHWQPFEISVFQQEQRSRRNILVWVCGNDPAVADRQGQLFESPEIRTAAFLNRCLFFRLDPDPMSEERINWIRRYAAKAGQGGFAMFAAGSRDSRVIDGSSVSVQDLLNLIEGVD